MRTIGFSTGALALDDFQKGLELSRQHELAALELSALRFHELEPLIHALPNLDLSGFRYVSLHAPSRYEGAEEPDVIDLVLRAAQRGIPVIVHPDAIVDAQAWRALGGMLCLENMDKRKPAGRSVPELAHFFDLLPEAGFCFDIGHARQFDPSMTEAELLLRAYGERLRQLHVSEVNTFSRHERLSYLSYFSYRRVAASIPAEIPIILEALVQPEEIEREVQFAIECLTPAPAREAGSATPVLSPAPARGD
jgi:sugar phosphate isomerase/epimerase